MDRLTIDIICEWEVGGLEGEVETFPEDIYLRDGEEFTQIWDCVRDYHGSETLRVVDIQLPELTREYFRHQGYDV